MRKILNQKPWQSKKVFRHAGLGSSPRMRGTLRRHPPHPARRRFIPADAEYLANELVGHISRDSTAIVGREKPVKKVAKEPTTPRKRGRPAKGAQREPAVEKRLDRQVQQTAEAAIAELPVACDRGTKKNAKGYKTPWNGYKLHLDINDVGLPISALVTSASLHDSQVAIPLIKQTSGKVSYLYDLMDAAYDAKRIEETSRALGHVPITDRNGRGREIIPMAPHEAERYKIRSSAERANSRLKEDFGAAPHSLIVPGELHFVEEEALKIWK